jgi:hypothetical protein
MQRAGLLDALFLCNLYCPGYSDSFAFTATSPQMDFPKATSICALVLFILTLFSSAISLYYYLKERPFSWRAFLHSQYTLQWLCALCALAALGLSGALLKLQSDPSQFELELQILRIAIFIEVLFVVTDTLRNVSFARIALSQN